jgi:adenylylsulfate kinase
MIDLQQNILKQKGMVIWLLGLSGAGKSTIATLLKETLDTARVSSLFCWMGTILRAGINSNLTYSVEDRAENVRRASEMAKILVGNNIITICSFITPLQEHRDLAHDHSGRALLRSICELSTGCLREKRHKRPL